MKNKTLFLQCDCSTHGLVLEKFDGEEELHLSLFQRYTRNIKLPWRERLRWCCQILFKGHPWTDQVLLNKEKQQQLKTFLENA